MATVYGVNSTKRDVTNPSEKINVNEEHGRLRVKYDTYVAAGAIAINEIIVMGKLPKGAKVYDVKLNSTDLGSAGLFDVGWAASADGAEAADADGFLNAANVNSAANSYSMFEDQASRPGQYKTFAGEVEVQIFVEEATTAAGTIHLSIEYALD